MTAAPIRFAALAVSPWHNGAGRKADIASGPGWHVGFAWLDQDAPFSDFSGQDRTITLIEGAGFVLDFASAPPLRVEAPHRPAKFDGGWPAMCRLLGGPGLVLNAMTERLAWRHTVTIADGAAVTDVEPGGAQACFAVVLSGAARVGGVDLAAHDTARITAPTALRTSAGSLLGVIRIEHA